MEVVSIVRKTNHLIFYSPLMTNDKFLTLPLLTPLEKNSGVVTDYYLNNLIVDGRNLN